MVTVLSEDCTSGIPLLLVAVGSWGIPGMSTSGGSHGRGRHGKRLCLPRVAFLGSKAHHLLPSPGPQQSPKQKPASRALRHVAWHPMEHQASLSPSAHQVESPGCRPRGSGQSLRAHKPGARQEQQERGGSFVPEFQYQTFLPSQWPCLYTCFGQCPVPRYD